MKLAFAILVLIAVVCSAPQKRFIFDAIFGINQFQNLDNLPTLVDELVGTVGTDATEQACETKCHTLIQADHLLQFGCPLICKNYQTLIHRFGHATDAPTSV
ncbi:uncharacterized protein [Mytilus edulis]|uniref:uncharacterized protein n=1 Tax=Mytilus edulis TaxID=6550 RepID=UPI0039F0B50D